MAITVTKTKDPSTNAERWVAGDHRIVTGEVKFDSSYEAGGEPITAADLGFDRRIDEIFFAPRYDDPANTRLATYDKAAGKVKLLISLAAEAAGGSDQSAVKMRFFAIGE